MKFHYYPETDNLYIELSSKTGEDVVEISPGVVIDYDENGKPVGIDIDNASKVVDLTRLEVEALPISALAVA
jgi:uncharacterized protein YuzE